MNYRHLLSIFFVYLFLGCATSVDSDKPDLQQMQSCLELENYIKSVVMFEQKNVYFKSSPFGWEDVTRLEGDQDAAAPPGDGKASATDFSTTNIQEAGVDEADFVKNDGSHIFVLNKENLVILDAWPVEEAYVISATQIEGWPSEMFVDFNSDLVAVFSSVNFQAVKEKFKLPDEVPPDECVVDKYGSCFYPTTVFWKPITKVTIFDVSDKTAPKLLRETYIEANYISSRMIKDTIHLVGYSNVSDPYYYTGCVDYPDGGWGEIIPAQYSGEEIDEVSLALDEASLYSKNGKKCMPYDEYIQKYQEKLGEVNYNDLLPKYYDIVYGDGGKKISKEIICSCDSFYKPTVINGKDIVSVISFNLKTGDFNGTAIVGQWGTLYASLNALYFASYIFDYWIYNLEGEKEKFEEYSTIHKFDISANPDKAEYVASGKVAGQILNQFSMSEHDGYFRVATTENMFWFNNGGNESKNNVFVLKENDGLLEVVGSVTGIAPTERIYSARFIKRKGYLVTFRQVDPLFTIDLADPYNPKVVGELKVPGFSTYLHPMDDQHLLAIGREATNEGVVLGLKLTIFDISDFKEPKERHTIILEEDWWSASAYSEAEYNHKAFNYFAPKNLLMIPFSYYNWDEDDGSGADNFNGLIVFKVTAENGFEEIGKIDHKDFYDDSMEYWCYYNYGVRRSVFMDDYIYSISDWGLKANLLPDLKLVNTIPFPASATQNYFSCGYME